MSGSRIAVEMVGSASVVWDTCLWCGVFKPLPVRGFYCSKACDLDAEMDADRYSADPDDDADFAPGDPSDGWRWR